MANVPANASVLDAASRGRPWAPAVLWGIGAFFLASLAVSKLFAGTGGSLANTMLRGQNIFTSCLWFAGAGTCYLVAVHYEHRARRLPLAQASGSLESVHARSSTLAGGIVLLLTGIGFISPAVHAQALAARSSYTQAHGTLRDARITNVTGNGGCAGSSCAYYTDVTVALNRPVAGRVSTVVNMPSQYPATTTGSAASLARRLMRASRPSVTMLDAIYSLSVVSIYVAFR